LHDGGGKRGGRSVTAHPPGTICRPKAAPFRVDKFLLYRSHLGHGGAHYQALASYPLTDLLEAKR
jgi:2'-5' RNA ligase